MKLINLIQLVFVASTALCTLTLACVAYCEWQQPGTSLAFTLLTLTMLPAIRQTYNEYKTED